MNKPLKADETKPAADNPQTGNMAAKADPSEEAVLNPAPLIAANAPRVLNNCLNIEDLRKAARRRVPRCVFEFFDRGSEDEVSLRHNRTAFQNTPLRDYCMAARPK